MKASTLPASREGLDVILVKEPENANTFFDKMFNNAISLTHNQIGLKLGIDSVSDIASIMLSKQGVWSESGYVYSTTSLTGKQALVLTTRWGNVLAVKRPAGIDIYVPQRITNFLGCKEASLLNTLKFYFGGFSTMNFGERLERAIGS